MGLVGLDQTVVGREAGLHLDVLADEALEHLFDLAHDGVQVDDHQVQHLLPAERQQLAGEGRRSFPSGLNLPEIVAQQFVLANLIEQHLAVPEDGREHVVEVVRDAPGQPSNAFQPLRVGQLLLYVAQLLLGLLP